MSQAVPMTDGTFTLVDAGGRNYLTAAERERFLEMARVRRRTRAERGPDRHAEALQEPLAKRSGTGTAHALELVHRLRSLEGEDCPIRSIARQTTNRQVREIM